MLGQWLDWTLDGKYPIPRLGRFASGTYQLHAPGILEITPSNVRPVAHACVFSAAIHGNETAPVELLGNWLSAIEAGTVTLGAPVLVILGNIPALKAQQRFITTNLNRLFNRELTETGEEPDRARELMSAIDAFYDRHQALPKLHYDLHTAIRGSLYTRFVVEPYAETVIAPEQWQWLAAADMQAVLHQHQHSWTFSHYSKHYHAAQAFTFELGRVAPFGKNDMAALAPMLTLICTLSAGEEPPKKPAQMMTFFQVKHELMRQAEAFSLCFDEDVPNFSRFEPGTCLAKDSVAGDFIVGDTPLHVVFPNSQVEIGARAALLVTPTHAA
ncbi:MULTISPECIES: succinylglutamate desuccinylase [Vreelandella]|uniref:Succinylglutamate desuccinylase n=2 Tax=Vreelandella TaxID=3137766 RepID=A0A7C9NNH7_9GAMM|nr:MULTISPECIES: succinylglutamate desuccinylase [Halomonas]NDL70989.1 succinylglutamate desuccinylase [Halomonas alkaliphila]NYS46391.1 succinylglutamate desuccinylase [Halomonas zhaodongensis]